MYCSKQDVLNYVLLDVQESFEDQIDSWIEISSREIDDLTNRTFIADSVATPRLYDGNNAVKLFIDDFVAMTGLKIDGATITLADVKLYPANTEHKNSLYYENGFTRGKQNVEVTAKWGYSEEPPEPIKFACVVLTASKILFSSRKNDIQRERIGNYEIQYMQGKEADVERVKMAINKYIKYAL